MSRFLNMLSRRVVDDPVAILWHYLCGRMVDYVDKPGGPVQWNTTTHRGVQWLHKVEFPRKQKRYIFSPQFQIKWDTDFEGVVRGCSHRANGDHTWVSEPLIRGLCRLHEMGYAHSFEAWHEGKLVGGAFGVQIGAMMSVDSMFHRMSNASKAAYGQTLVRLQERGFKVVDTNGVAQHQVNYGEEWMPHWEFEKLSAQMLRSSPAPSLVDDRPYPAKLPWEIRMMLPVCRVAKPLLRRLSRAPKTATANAPAGVPPVEPGSQTPAPSVPLAPTVPLENKSSSAA